MTVSADRRTLYLFFAHRAAGPLVVNGLGNAVTGARVLGTDQPVQTWRTGGAGFGGSARPLFLRLPAGAEDELMTVIALDLESELDLYRGAGRITYTEDSL
jgi:alpha-L-fucosidase